MSSMPQCDCGLYVHSGDCLCQDCAVKLKEKLDEANRLLGEIIKPGGMTPGRWVEFALEVIKFLNKGCTCQSEDVYDPKYITYLHPGWN